MKKLLLVIGIFLLFTSCDTKQSLDGKILKDKDGNYYELSELNKYNDTYYVVLIDISAKQPFE